MRNLSADPKIDLAKLRNARAACTNIQHRLRSLKSEEGLYFRLMGAYTWLNTLLAESDNLVDRCTSYAKKIVKKLDPLETTDQGEDILQVLNGLIVKGQPIIEDTQRKWSYAHFQNLFDEFSSIGEALKRYQNSVEGARKEKEHHLQAHKDQTIVASTFGGVAAASLLAAPFTLGISLVVFTVAGVISAGTGIGAGVNGIQANQIQIQDFNSQGAAELVDDIQRSLEELVSGYVIFADYWRGLVDYMAKIKNELEPNYPPGQHQFDPAQSYARAVRRLRESNKGWDISEERQEDETIEGYAKRLWLKSMVAVDRLNELFLES